ncbi:hypothetical protein [Alienimonas sp. DA493]|uniref:hypothetical protein n=1 Tax=Alienimonas sp. DA493 TaxID=3373605 RepID=UPI0037552E8A
MLNRRSPAPHVPSASRLSAALTAFALLGLALPLAGCGGGVEDGYVPPSDDPTAEAPPAGDEPYDPNDA